jgi:hypothetical protein
LQSTGPLISYIAIAEFGDPGCRHPVPYLVDRPPSSAASVRRRRVAECGDGCVPIDLSRFERNDIPNAGRRFERLVVSPADDRPATSP